MREIKFRAWDKEDKSMSDSFDLNDMHEASYMGIKTQKHIDNYLIIQYTGLKDKNGVEIYEGDILSCYCPSLGDRRKVRKWYKRIVFFKEGCFRYREGDISWAMGDYGWQAEKAEVIGNIYANPELLEATT